MATLLIEEKTCQRVKKEIKVLSPDLEVLLPIPGYKPIVFYSTI